MKSNLCYVRFQILEFRGDDTKNCLSHLMKITIKIDQVNSWRNKIDVPAPVVSLQVNLSLRYRKNS